MKTQSKTKTTGRARANGTTSAGGTRKAAMSPASKTEEVSEGEAGSYLDNLLMTMLKEMYWGEKQQVTALSEMQQQCTTRELHDAFEDHLYVTKKHIARLERVFSTLGVAPEEKNCLGIAALIEESRETINSTKVNTLTRDAALIIAAQKLEHYEIATYGSLVQVALTLDYTEAAAILEKTLLEEEGTDRMLTDIAECEVNPLADDEPLSVFTVVEEELEYA
jgi:ferritin-like metal-binding protein YciE